MSDALWQYSAIASFLADHQIACGVIRHPVTRNWQTWFSLYGTDITCIFSTKSYSLAHSVRQMFVVELRAGLMTDSDQAQSFMADIQAIDGSELIDPLPQRALESLAKQIRRQLVNEASDS
ncbi:hypothetical protein PN498_17630 [Oscillatoria sp. CS-180]|uniref:hypothetical protein n=1 Tax=Oscillatoria sp. CS-180 TaxID=3021720 RepID=UPI002330B730|nr:hypothetical protein [Oscillatoria sp. CS-180]MDB9527820.1 hypothetical protein [Oscillatoria sp. CS-180]